MTEPIRVLHIDDDPDFAQLVAEHLERENRRLSVATATDSADGLERLRTEGADCVLCDYDMPGLDGLEVLQAVRREDGDLPFVLFTGKGSEEIASEAISAGVTDYIQKEPGPEQYSVLANRIVNLVARHRAEAAVEAAHERFGKLIETSTDVIFIADRQGRFTYLSPSVERILGYPPEELVGENGFDYVHPEDVAALREYYFDAVRDPDRSPLARFRARHADGSWVPFEVRGRNLLDDPVVEGFVVNGRDVTERRDRERALANSELMVETAADGLYILDENLQYVAVNDAMAELTGYPRERLEGSHISIHLDGDGVRAALDARSSIEPGEKTELVLEQDFRTADGARRPVEVRFRPIPAEDGFRGTVGVVRDIGDRKRRERELRRKNERLDAFASVVSHDLVNPLAVAEGYLGEYRDSGDPAHLDAVERAHDRMGSIVDDVLALAREGRRVRDPAPVTLGRVARSAWGSVKTVSASLEVVQDAVVLADERRLRRLLENLFSNAVRHAGPAPSVRLAATDEGFVVEDDGDGIPEGDRETVFEPGFSTEPGGTGYGLAIVRDIAAAHGWTVTVDRGSMAGARFSFAGVDFGADDGTAEPVESADAPDRNGSPGSEGSTDPRDGSGESADPDGSTEPETRADGLG